MDACHSTDVPVKHFVKIEPKTPFGRAIAAVEIKSEGLIDD
jgi:hypothetical protein